MSFKYLWPRNILFFAQTKRPLETADYQGKTLLLHAASVGSSPVFTAVFQAMEMAFKSDEGVSADVSSFRHNRFI